MATPSPGQAPSPSYMDMLVESDGGVTLTALETIRGASTAGPAPDDVPDVHRDEKSEQHQQGARGRELAFRVSTPERIRRKSELLYGEIHTMMERHDVRTGREREVQRRASRGSRVMNPVRSPSITRQSNRPAHDESAELPMAPLPDLHQMFAESRRAHLAEAQKQRTYFPSSCKPTTYSAKDPGMFSFRFQSPDPPSSDK